MLPAVSSLYVFYVYEIAERIYFIVTDELSLEQIMLSMQKTQRHENTCDCLPACASLQYDAETSQAYFNWIKLFGAYKENMSEFDG